jgi:hypothetical protein
MYYCYVDESGNAEVINNPNDNVQPMVIISGLIIKADKIVQLTNEFVSLKRIFYPGLFAGIPFNINSLLKEIKGSDIRSDIRKATNLNDNKVQHNFLFLDEIFTLLKKHDVKIVSRIWVKAFGAVLHDQPIYGITTQQFAVRFQSFLDANDSYGGIIADFRDPKRNSYISHSVYTQKYKKAGDAYPRIHEMPTFAISDNHAMLQICDLLCSAIIYPIGGIKLCAGFVNNVHTSPNYSWIAQRYTKRLRSLQYNCKLNGQMYWGITADNKHNPMQSSIF